jgi:xanthine dehydrogenase accessory factor
MPVFEELVRSRSQGKKAALALIVQCVGSSPQKEGAKMLVHEDGAIVGTLGGGCLEEEVRQVCLAAIEEGTARTISVGLTEHEGGMVCGGRVLVYIEPVLPEPRLVILGAGHVGRALAQAAAHAGFRVSVIDDRAEHAAPERFPDVERILVGPFVSTLAGAGIDGTTYLLVATRGHLQDFEAVAAALRTPARYVGLVGSRRKRKLLFEELERQGFDAAARSRVVTPAGVAIGSVTPAEIAVSIVAQMIEVRRSHERTDRGAAPRGGALAADGCRETQATVPLR